ncbi:MAG TPA: hypothetical protein VLJ41_01545, partial [Segetibacter sp.]|nr:hypothetical protein [Segetibacter sp.]
MKQLPLYLFLLIAVFYLFSFKSGDTGGLVAGSVMAKVATQEREIWVSLKGSDVDNDGTKKRPFASVAMALRKARELRRLNDTSIVGGIRIKVEGGVYRFEEPLFIRPEDSGTESSPTTIENANNVKPVFSGGITVAGWKKVAGKIVGLPKEAYGKVWVADAPMIGGRPLEFRQLWINDEKAVRAREKNADSMY